MQHVCLALQVPYKRIIYYLHMCRKGDVTWHTGKGSMSLRRVGSHSRHQAHTHRQTWPEMEMETGRRVCKVQTQVQAGMVSSVPSP